MGCEGDDALRAGRRAFLAAVLMAGVVPARAQTAQAAPFAWRLAGAPGDDFDTSALARLTDLLRSDYPATLALTIAQKDRIVLDYRRVGVPRDATFRLYSVTKSVVALLAGIALDRGLLPSLDAPVAPYFPEIDTSAADPRLATVTIRHILTLTAGWETGLQPVPAVTASGLLRPFATDPGRVFSYDNNATNILGMLLARAVRAPLDDFAREALFRPIGIDGFEWRRTPDGHPAASGGLGLTMDATIRLGRLALRKGDWDGRRIVSAEFMAAALARRVQANAQEGLDYGYLWFTRRTPDNRHETHIAQGFGGQVLLIAPALNLIVATTTEPGPHASTDFIRGAILPAARG